MQQVTGPRFALPRERRDELREKAHRDWRLDAYPAALNLMIKDSRLASSWSAMSELGQGCRPDRPLGVGLLPVTVAPASVTTSRCARSGYFILVYQAVNQRPERLATNSNRNPATCKRPQRLTGLSAE